MASTIPDYWPFSSDYYHTSGRSDRVRLVHIKAPAEAFPRRRPADALSFCGMAAWDCRNAPKVSHAPDQPLPAGLGWCPKCLGVAASHLGLARSVERLVVKGLLRRLRSLPTAEELLASTASPEPQGDKR